MIHTFLVNLFGFNPFVKPELKGVKPSGTSHTICPKSFDEKWIWDKQRFNNIQYVD
jgi:hypothetical protein